MFRNLLLSVLSLFLFSTIAAAQDEGPGTQLDKIPIQKKLLPYSNPVNPVDSETVVTSANEPLNLNDREALQRITDVYRIHVLAIESQVNDDLVSAESYINDAIASIQSLMNDYPEIQNNNRFTELYRTVMLEYREFYGISEPVNQVEGEIFAIQEELFSGSDDWIVEGYALPDNLTFSTTEVPLIQNEPVTRQLMYYTLRRPEVMERWLERSEKYFPMMRQIFEEEGAPVELIHLSMIESGLVPTARSWAAAVGLWQFIRATGSMYGLEVNFWIDERRDPVKSTRAAARHLVDLYGIWGDWHLAMANYNISPRGLNRAINAAGGEKNYWTALPYLPRETQGYVPGFIAAATIAMNPEEFGFQRYFGAEPYSYDVVDVAGLMSLDKLAEIAGITTQELKEYNPELLRWATPPGNEYPLKIPRGIMDDFLAAYNEIPVDELTQDVAMHTVSSGENLGYIAGRYGTTVEALFSTNDGLSTTIHPGQTIVVPVANGAMGQISADQPSNSSTGTRQQSQPRVQQPANTIALTYTVKSGDTVGHIAEWYDVRSWEIRAWNGIGNIIRADQGLTVYVPGNRREFYQQINQLTFSQKQELQRLQREGRDIYSIRYASAGTSTTGSGGDITYTVRQNDTLSNIAQNFGVTVAEIQRLNDLAGTRIYAGQTIRIQPSE